MEWTPDENMPPEEFGPNSKRFTALQRMVGIKKKPKNSQSAGVRQGEEQEFRRKHSDTEEDLQSHSSGTLREHGKTIVQTDSLWQQCWEFIFEHGH